MITGQSLPAQGTLSFICFSLPLLQTTRTEDMTAVRNPCPCFVLADRTCRTCNSRTLWRRCHSFPCLGFLPAHPNLQALVISAPLVCFHAVQLSSPMQDMDNLVELSSGWAGCWSCMRARSITPSLIVDPAKGIIKNSVLTCLITFVNLVFGVQVDGICYSC